MKNNNLKKFFLIGIVLFLFVTDSILLKIYKKELEEYIMFLFGGPKRFEEIQKLFEFYINMFKIYFNK